MVHGRNLSSTFFDFSLTGGRKNAKNYLDSLTAGQDTDHQEWQLKCTCHCALSEDPVTDHKRILHYGDHLSGYSQVGCLASKSSKKAGEALVQILSSSLLPKVLQSDNGGEFLGELVLEQRNLCNVMFYLYTDFGSQHFCSFHVAASK
jgi:hypothetical protein